MNYILIKNINDSKNDALELVRLIKKKNLSIMFSKLNNANKFNKFLPSEKYKAIKFKKILKKNKINYKNFYNKSIDIKGGCGQLRCKNISYVR